MGDFMSEQANKNESKQSFLYLSQDAIKLKLGTAQLLDDGDKSIQMFGKLRENASSQRLKESASRLRLRLRQGREIF